MHNGTDHHTPGVVTILDLEVRSANAFMIEGLLYPDSELLHPP